MSENTEETPQPQELALGLPTSKWLQITAAFKRIPTLAYSVYFMLTDKSTPTWVRLMLGIAFLYLLMPIDLIPDVIPGLGLVDDALVIMGTISSLVANVNADHVFQAKHKLRIKD